MTTSNGVEGDPHHGLMAEAHREREVFDSPEAQALLDAVYDAVGALSDFFERNDLIWEHGFDCSRLKASELVVTVNYACVNTGAIAVVLKDGACDRIYGNGTNPDPAGLGPPDIPQKPRDDDYGRDDVDNPKRLVGWAVPVYERTDQRSDN
jgi:hypothetical protein